MAIVERKKWKKGDDGAQYHWSTWVLKYEKYDFQDLDIVSKLIIDNLEEKFCPPKFRKINKINPLFGHCYHSTQSLYYFMDKELKIMSADCDGPGERHWWLQDEDTIIDITASQYDRLDVEPPYEKGKVSKWYGWKHRPHKKTLVLMNKVQPKSELEFFNHDKKEYNVI